MTSLHKKSPCSSKTRAFLKSHYRRDDDKGNTMKNNSNYCNSTVSQRKRILDYLRSKPLTTLAERIDLDIMHPAARVMELKAQGHEIYTHWETVDSGQGKHRVASYVLLSGGASHD